MPNYISNRLTIFGTKEQVYLVKDFLKLEESDSEEEITGIGTIDFNKITPMPKWVYADDLGQQAKDKYGPENCWYDWCCSNWGTKWNAFWQHIKEGKENSLYFTTVWSCPLILIRNLSWIFPDVEIEIAWADVDNRGYDLGIMRFKDGVVTYKNMPDEGSKAAFKLYHKIMKDS